MPQDVALPEASGVWNCFWTEWEITDGWRCQICQYWTDGTNLMVDLLFQQHHLAPVYVGVASIYAPD